MTKDLYLYLDVYLWFVEVWIGVYREAGKFGLEVNWGMSGSMKKLGTAVTYTAYEPEPDHNYEVPARD